MAPHLATGFVSHPAPGRSAKGDRAAAAIDEAGDAAPSTTIPPAGPALADLPWAQTRTLLLQLRQELQQRGYGGLAALNLELWVRHYLRCLLPGPERRLQPAEIDPYLDHLRCSHGATAVQLAEARLALALLHGAVLEQTL